MDTTREDFEKWAISHRDLIVVALQSLHRERVTAYNAACTAYYLAGKPSPDEDLFGLNESSAALRSVGAGPGLR